MRSLRRRRYFYLWRVCGAADWGVKAHTFCGRLLSVDSIRLKHPPAKFRRLYLALILGKKYGKHEINRPISNRTGRW